MMTFQTQATIARPAGEVWAFAADILRHPQWMAVTDARVLSGQGTQKGDRGREGMRFGPFHWDIELEVAEAERGRRIVWRALRGAPFHLDVELDLESTGPSSTRATYRSALQLQGFWRLLTPIVALEGRAGAARELQRLKELLEAHPDPAAVTA